MAKGAALALNIGVSAAVALLDVLIRWPRLIQGSQGALVPDCAVEETSRDDLQITEHPVEYGSVIADHAFKKPREITLRWSWSNSGRAEDAAQAIFAALTQMQAAREPLTIYTGKGIYTSMLIASLGVTTNSSSEYALQATMVCREVIIVSTLSVQVSQADMAEPQTTGGVANQGNLVAQQQSSTFGSGIASNTQGLTATGPGNIAGGALPSPSP